MLKIALSKHRQIQEDRYGFICLYAEIRFTQRITFYPKKVALCFKLWHARIRRMAQFAYIDATLHNKVSNRLLQLRIFKMNAVLLSTENDIALVTLNRPEKRNALTLEMLETLLDHQQTIAKDPHLRAVIIKGAGKSFCAGLDMMSVIQNPQQIKKLLTPISKQLGNLVQAAACGWQTLNIPVIAVLHGHVLGAGLQLALGAHFRYAEVTETQLSIKEIHWGLIPDMGISNMLPELAPRDRILDWVLTGRDILVEEALNYHLITQASENPLEQALDFVQHIACKSPDAISAALHLFKDQRQRTAAENLKTEALLQEKLLGQPNQLQAVEAKLTKKRPEFKPSRLDMNALQVE